MNYTLTEIIGSPAPPLLITLDDAKAHLYQDHDDQDGQITAMIRAATQAAEHYTRRVFLSRTFVMGLDAFPRGGGVWPCPNQDGEVWPPRFGNLSRGVRFPDAILLPLAPLGAVVSIAYTSTELDDDGAPIDASVTQWQAAANGNPPYIVPAFGKCWPCTADVPEAVRVTFSAGYGEPGDVPEAIKSAVRLMLGDLFRVREDMPLTGDTPNQRSAQALLAPYRMFRQ